MVLAVSGESAASLGLAFLTQETSNSDTQEPAVRVGARRPLLKVPPPVAVAFAAGRILLRFRGSLLRL